MTQLRFAQLMARVVDRPLLILPRHAMAMWNTLCDRFGAAPGSLPPDPHADLIDAHFAHAASPKPKASRLAGSDEGPDGKWVPYRVQNGVGILSVVGELVNRGAWIGANSGLVSYEGIKFQLERLGADPNVRNVILDIESPGGEAVGFEVAVDAVRKLSAEKPVYAVVNGMAASAAYALASGARRIFTSPTGVVGSIGVVMLHLDFSGMLEQDGVKPTLIFAGAHKVDGNPFEALPESVREDLQAEVFAFYDTFVQTVAQGRAGKTSAKAARDTEARTFVGRDAIDARLADDIGTFEQVLDALSARNTRKSARSQAMSNRNRAARKASAEAAERDDDDLLEAEAEAESEPEPEAEPEAEPASASRRAQPAPTSRNADAVRYGADQLAARIMTILGDERSQGRERFAVTLACEARDMSPEKVLELAAQGASIPGVRSIAARAADTGAEGISSAPGKEPGAARTSWKKATSAVNSRVQQH